jgi:hypothetical protein
MGFNPVPKFPPGARTRMEARTDKKTAAERRELELHNAVDARDGKICRVSGLELKPFHDNPRRRLNRHHMKPRSTAPAEKYDPANVITISDWISDQIHNRRKLHLEGDANLRDAEGKFCGVLLSQDSELGWQPVRLV